MSAHTIALQSGGRFDLAEPHFSTFDIVDVAQGLGAICRFTGHTREFYSVAEHCVIAASLARSDAAYAALMHDAAEAFIGDVSTPLKQLLPDYRAIERAVEAELFRRFDVPDPLPDEVKRVDRYLLEQEQRRFMQKPDFLQSPFDNRPWAVNFPCWSPAEASRQFLAAFLRLRPPC